MKENAHSSQYLLMNKDVCILHFSCTHNEFGEALFAEEEWLVQYRPIGYHGLQDFLERRRAPSTGRISENYWHNAAAVAWKDFCGSHMLFR